MLIPPGGERLGAVVDVQQDRVVVLARGPDHFGDVSLDDAHARIEERRVREVADELSVPAHDRADELDHVDDGVGAEGRERRARREAHSQPADEHARARQGVQARAAALGQLLLRAVALARHEHVAVDADRVLVAAPRERHLAAVVHACAIEGPPGEQGANLTRSRAFARAGPPPSSGEAGRNRRLAPST